MNKKIQKVLSVILSIFFFTGASWQKKVNSVSKLWWLTTLAVVPAVGIPVACWLSKKNDENNSLNLVSNLDPFTNGSLAWSPFSFKAALVMAANGTSNEEARKNVAKYVGFESLEDANSWLENIMDTQPKDIDIANSMWIVKKYSNNINKNFKDLIIKKFKAKCENVDIENGHEVINNWVSEKTRRKILNIVEKLDEKDILVLVNTIYFNSKFVKEFKDTGSIKFNGVNKTIEDVPTIKDKNNRWCDYCETNYYQAVKIPFKNECNLYMVLPKKNELFDKVKDIDVNQLAKNMQNERVIIEIPRFKIESSLSLKDYCNNNELLKPFINSIFDKIHPKAIISEIRQKVFWETKPKGVEAAAVTMIRMQKACPCLEKLKPDIKIIFDHAFIGFITDKDNNVLFKVNVKDIDSIENAKDSEGEYRRAIVKA